MNTISQTIHHQHQEMMNSLQKQVIDLVEKRPEADPEQLAAFLKNELLLHTVSEEQLLYSAVEALIRAHGQATATLRVDHEFIVDSIRQMDEPAQALRLKRVNERRNLEERLRRLVLQLEAVLRLHL